jgi:hypothetical protein
MPVLWQSEHQAVLAYHASPKAPGGPYCVVAFEGCLIATFGYPNDDALPGHPLHDKGLEWYGFYEVEGVFVDRQVEGAERRHVPRR